MRTILTLGGLAIIVTLVVVNLPGIPGSRLASNPLSQSASVVIYDEYGNPQVYPDDSVYDQPDVVDYYPQSDYYGYPTDYGYTDNSSLYDGGNDLSNSPYDYYSSGDVTYDEWGNTYYNYAPPPPPPPPQPFYVQALPGVSSITQPIVQGLAPQTRTYSRPTCSISANPSTVPLNGSTVIRWASQGSDWSNLTGLGTVDPSSSWQFDDMTHTTTFVLSLSGQGGTGSCSTVVTVMSH